MDDFTTILHSVSRGEDQNAEVLLPPTVLVHEAWLRLVKDEERNWRNRAYFFSAAATTMRRILVEYARRKARPNTNGVMQQDKYL
jgi:hypothetical protein